MFIITIISLIIVIITIIYVILNDGAKYAEG